MKAKREVNGEDTANARIRINYSKKKPVVSFRYPDKKNQFRGSMLPYIFLAWLIMNIPVFIWIQSDLGEEKDLSNYEKWVEYKTSEKYLIESYEMFKHPLTGLFFGIFNKHSLIKSSLILIYIFGIPLLIYYPCRRTWKRIFPDFQAFLATKKYKTFKATDVIERNGRYYVELPVFNNILCDFKATKDFSKYLNEFEIEEHKFYYYKGKKKKRLNEWLWYARWYFTQPIQKGVLEVKFK